MLLMPVQSSIILLGDNIIEGEGSEGGKWRGGEERRELESWISWDHSMEGRTLLFHPFLWLCDKKYEQKEGQKSKLTIIKILLTSRSSLSCSMKERCDPSSVQKQVVVATKEVCQLTL